MIKLSCLQMSVLLKIFFSSHSCSEHGFLEGAETLFLVEDESPRSEL